MLEKEFMQVNCRETQREAARLALVKEARAAQQTATEKVIAEGRRKHRRGLLSLASVVQGARGFVTQPS